MERKRVNNVHGDYNRGPSCFNVPWGRRLKATWMASKSHHFNPNDKKKKKHKKIHLYLPPLSFHTHKCMHTHTHTCTYTQTCMHVHTHKHACTYTHTHTHTHTHACTYTHTHTHMHARTHTHTCMHVHTHTHTQTFQSWPNYGPPKTVPSSHTYRGVCRKNNPGVTSIISRITKAYTSLSRRPHHIIKRLFYSCFKKYTCCSPRDVIPHTHPSFPKIVVPSVCAAMLNGSSSALWRPHSQGKVTCCFPSSRRTDDTDTDDTDGAVATPWLPRPPRNRAAISTHQGEREGEKEREREREKKTGKKRRSQPTRCREARRTGTGCVFIDILRDFFFRVSKRVAVTSRQEREERRNLTFYWFIIAVRHEWTPAAAAAAAAGQRGVQGADGPGERVSLQLPGTEMRGEYWWWSQMSRTRTCTRTYGRAHANTHTPLHALAR